MKNQAITQHYYNSSEANWQEQRRRERRLYIVPQIDKPDKCNRIMDGFGYGIAFVVVMSALTVVYIQVLRVIGWW